jgi:hypothetical protein
LNTNKSQLLRAEEKTGQGGGFSENNENIFKVGCEAERDQDQKRSS